MRLLLDTHVLLWVIGKSKRLAAATRDVLADPANDVLFSAASIWEIAIKARLGRMDFALRPEVVVQAARNSGFVELPILADAAARVADLPLHHRDPFDRLLVAQAISAPMRLYTADAALQPYSELITVIA